MKSQRILLFLAILASWRLIQTIFPSDVRIILEAFWLTGLITSISRRKMKGAMTKLMVPSDAELLRLMLAGDEQAFTALCRRHKGHVCPFALLMSGQASISEVS